MGNININGETAVHAKSEGVLTAPNVGLTLPFCVPITYTNVAESKTADQTVRSVKVQGSPVCNQKSTFKISQGDAPGTCAGAGSGTIGQMAQFKQGSQTVTIGGEPAVTNGHLMTSNMDNTGPQPLIQPPAGMAPAGIADAPKAVTGEFSQQFDFSNYIGLIQDETKILERPNYKITNQDGTQNWHGALGSTGLTERVFTTESETLLVWLGDGNWKIFAEHDHGSHEDEEAKSGANTATLRLGFINFASAALSELDYKLVVNGKETSGKTNEYGGTETLTDLSPGAQVDILVLRETTQDYKKIGTIKALAGETHYTIVSPRVKIEAATEKHMGAAAATPAAPAPAAPAARAAGITPQKTKAKTSRNPAGHPQATVAEESLGALLYKDFLAILNRWTWSDFNSAKPANKPTQAHPRINQALLPSLVPLGKPLSQNNLANLHKLVEIAEGQIIMDFKGCEGLKDSKGKRIGSTISVLAKFQVEGDKPDFAYDYVDKKTKKPTHSNGSKPSNKPNGLCLCYVKVAMHRANYIGGIPSAQYAKDSGADWTNPSCGFTNVSATLPPFPQVEITYKHTTITQPDLMYTLPGDIIVYEQVDPEDDEAAGHIDIRTYHNFVSDFARAFPLPTLGSGLGAHYKVTGVYRKISDTMAMVRVEAFLRILREQVAGETSLAEKDRSYHLLTYDKDGKEPFAVGNRNGDLEKGHPSNLEDDDLAGAYQISYSQWDKTIKATGWPRTFTPKMQDRIAMYLLQRSPNNFEIKPPIHPRRSALGYIMEGEIEKAVNIIKHESTLSDWHGITNQKLDMAALKPKFDKYIQVSAK